MFIWLGPPCRIPGLVSPTLLGLGIRMRRYDAIFFVNYHMNLFHYIVLSAVMKGIILSRTYFSTAEHGPRPFTADFVPCLGGFGLLIQRWRHEVVMGLFSIFSSVCRGFFNLDIRLVGFYKF